MLGLENPNYKSVRRRSFAGASTGNLYQSWTTTNQSADAELRLNLSALRARSRDLERNDAYCKKFFRMVKSNVIGPAGIKLQSQVVNDNGQADEVARRKIEEAWARWIKKGICDVTGKHSFKAIQDLVISSVARDGEVLVRKIRNVENKFSFALQLIEADHLDERRTETLSNGNKIKMGVEYDSWNRPQAYHIYPDHPGDYVYGYSFGDTIRIPADEILHIFHPMRISQMRGLPWPHAAMARLNMLGGYEEAELVASRIAAAKGGFYTKKTGDGELTSVGDVIEDGQPIQEVEPGKYEILPDGWDFKEFDPQHPTTAYKDFVKAMLRGVASGLDVSYNYLANDLEGVNYSSIRAGLLDERDVWRTLQRFMVEYLLDPVFAEWLSMGLLTQEITLPFPKYDKFNRAKWQPRGWAWVDPLKDAQAKLLEINSGLNTGAAIAAEQGKDLEEIYEQLAQEKALAEKYGLKFSEIKITIGGNNGSE